MSKRKLIEDLIVLLVLIALCVYVIFATFDFKKTAGLLPRLVSCVTGLLCAVQVCSTLAKLRRCDAGKGVGEGEVGRVTMNRLLLASLMLIGYFVLTLVLGFYAATILFLAGSMWLFGYRNKLAIVLICTGISLFSYLLFQKLLYVKLPMGIFG